MKILPTILAIAVLCPLLPAHAQLTGKERGAWISSVENQRGWNCCTLADGYYLEAVEWEIRRDRYWVFLREDNQWHEVQDWALIKGPNKAGRALVWAFYDHEGDDAPDDKPGWVVKCFAWGELI